MIQPCVLHRKSDLYGVLPVDGVLLHANLAIAAHTHVRVITHLTHLLLRER